MPRKILSLALVAVIAITLTLQLGTVQVHAAPVTSPVTTPVTFANLAGKVTLRQLGRLLGNAQRIVPVENAVVMVRGFFNKSQTYQTTTDANGNYSLNLPAGLYTVDVDGKSISGAAFFVPPFHVEQVRSNTTRTADFQGLLFPHL